MAGPTYTPYLRLGYGSDADENRNWDRLDTAALQIALGLLADIPAGGDLSGFYPNPSIRDGAVTDPKISSVSWSKITGAPAGLPPLGPAGGALQGTYPNPTIAPGQVFLSSLDPVVQTQLMPLPVFPTDQGKVLTSEIGTGIAKWLPSTGGGLPDAPADGTLYGRKDLAWTAVPAGSPGPAGPQGPQGEPGISAGKILYYAPSDASDIATYKTLLTSPSAGAEQTIATPCTGTGDVLVAVFATDPGAIGAVDYPAGTAFRRIYAMVQAGTARLHLQVYKRDAAGVETLIRDEFSPNFTDQVPILQEWTSVAASAGTLLATDRIVNKIYAQRVTGPTTVTVTTYYEGSSHSSHIQTTISTGAQGPPGPGVAAGGTTGQVLTKTSATDYATAWQTPAAATAIGAAAPGSPVAGQLWWRSDPDANLFVYYNDGDSSQWVAAVPASTGGTAPTFPVNSNGALPTAGLHATNFTKIATFSGTLAGTSLVIVTLMVKIVDSAGSTAGTFKGELRIGGGATFAAMQCPYAISSYMQAPASMVLAASVVRAGATDIELWAAGAGIEPQWGSCTVIAFG